MSEWGPAVGQAPAMGPSLDLFSVAVRIDENVVCLDFCLGKVLRCLQEDWLGMEAAGGRRWDGNRKERLGMADLGLFCGTS